MNKKWLLLVGMLCLCNVICAMMEEWDPIALEGSINGDQGGVAEYTSLLPGRASPDPDLESLPHWCPRLKSLCCAWWKNGNCYCCQSQHPGYLHAIFAGGLITVASVAVVCVWRYGSSGPECHNDDC